MLLQAALLYCLVTVVGCVVLALPGVTFAVLAGLLFGPWLGTLLCLLATTVGAIIAFVVGRFFLQDSIRPLVMKNKWIKKQPNLLAEQFEMLTWNEKQDNYDPIVPNDVSDAATYAIISWFKNPENIQHFNIQKLMGRGFKLIRDMINEKE